MILKAVLVDAHGIIDLLKSLESQVVDNAKDQEESCVPEWLGLGRCGKGNEVGQDSRKTKLVIQETDLTRVEDPEQNEQERDGNL